jgi:hypothetical protein
MTALRHRAGHTLAEAVAALAVGAVLLVIGAALLATQARSAADVGAATAAAEVERTVWAVLSGELRYADRTQDVRAVAADSLAFRSFRGMALPCGARADASLYHYTGMRRPAAGKDSAVGALSGRAAAILQAGNAAVDVRCAPAGASVLTVRTDPLLPSEPLLIFESGAYHLISGAFRFRLGAEGRQPLTDELLDTRRSAFTGTTGTSIGVRLVFDSLRRAGVAAVFEASFPMMHDAAVR